MTCKSKFLAKIHHKICPTSKDGSFFGDLLDVAFSPNYGWPVVKYESKHFYKEWIASKRSHRK